MGSNFAEPLTRGVFGSETLPGDWCMTELATLTGRWRKVPAGWTRLAPAGRPDLRGCAPLDAWRYCRRD
eukprot:7296101-Prymnesium_polylepis.1